MRTLDSDMHKVVCLLALAVTKIRRYLYSSLQPDSMEAWNCRRPVWLPTGAKDSPWPLIAGQPSGNEAETISHPSLRQGSHSNRGSSCSRCYDLGCMSGWYHGCFSVLED